MGFYASFVLTFRVRWQLPKSLVTLLLPASPPSTGCRLVSPSPLAYRGELLALLGAPHPSQLHPAAPSLGWVPKQLEELTRRRGEAGLAQGAAETHVKAGRRSEARLEMFARGNASNASLMTLLLL